MATDYVPATCSARAAYIGRPLHPPVAIGTIEPPGGNAVDPATADRLAKALAEVKRRTGAVAITASVALAGGGSWTGDDPQTAPLPLFWASAGKTFTAVVVLQLVQEGRLTLDDPVARWVKNVPNGDGVTIRDLLAHTSGLFSANEDLKAHADPRYRDPGETLAIARKHGAMFCPGANWRYSNTGYDLLGTVIEKIEGRPINVSIARRIIEPLGLTSMIAMPPGARTTGIAPLVSAREKPIDPSWAGAAGPVAGSASDMVKFWAALLGGKLLNRQLTDQMTATLYPMFDPGTFYGLGAMVFDLTDGDRRLYWIGHAGGTPGASAIAFYSPGDRAFVAVALTGDGSATAAANALLKALAAGL